MKNLISIILIVGLASAAWAWDPPARNGVKPGALFKQRMADLIDEIDDRGHELLEKVAESADQSAIEAQGRFSLDASQFSNFRRFPQVSEGRVWRISNGRGSYASTVELNFETLDVTKLGSAENSTELAEIRATMEQWQKYIRQRPRPDIDPGVWANLNEYYDDIHDWIPLKAEQADANFDHFIYVARYNGAAGVNGGRDGIAAVGLGTFNHTTSEAYLNFVTSNPYAMVRQGSRTEGAVGSAGTPVIDYGMRHLSTVEGVEKLSVSAENNRVGVYARSRGFEAVCDDALENPIFVGGQGSEDLGEGVVNPAFGGGDDDVSPYD